MHTRVSLPIGIRIWEKNISKPWCWLPFLSISNSAHLMSM
uniref:Uncharacterized protein n=1 Tax=Molossus molossus TaxID=27622 RepID=A0A7J8JRH8_MOLMO|nr:hypothetical protein HJG59_000573 [Molossus molossus]